MKINKNRDNSSPHRPGRFYKERGVMLFGLLMATALPALFALIGNIGYSRAPQRPWDDRSISIYRHEEMQSDESLSLREIIALSLAATNPSDTPTHSLAAQAIALRSRAIWWIDYCEAWEESDVNADRSSQSARLHLCDDPAHGLPYLSAKELASIWGKEEASKRIQAGEQAVDDTRGMVLCYEGQVIPALLHHSAPKSTRCVKELQWVSGVNTPEEGKKQSLTYSIEEVRLRIASAFGIAISENSQEWEISTQADSVGWVEQVKMGDTVVSGDAFADALALPSACFTLQIERNCFIVTTTGEGSGCGLSREGASIYARGGLNYGEILAHYYPQCTVEYLESVPIHGDNG